MKAIGTRKVKLIVDTIFETKAQVLQYFHLI